MEVMEAGVAVIPQVVVAVVAQEDVYGSEVIISISQMRSSMRKAEMVAMVVNTIASQVVAVVAAVVE